MKKTVKNPYISIAKLIAAICLTFTHIKFPGIPGNLIDGAARFGVPFFFAISGYFSYKTTSVRLVKRLKRLIFILLISDIIYLGWDLFINCCIARHGVTEYVSSLVSIKQFALFLFADNRSGHSTFHLWYLTAQIKIYLIYYLYLRFINDRSSYKPLYYAAFSSLLLNLGLGLFSIIAGINTDPIITRNWLFMGFPVFTYGLFIHNYENELVNGFNLNKFKLFVLILAGFILSFLELLGVGKTELALGMIFVVGSLVLWITNFMPTLSEKALLSKLSTANLDTISLIIYIIHPLFFYIANSFPVFQPVIQNGWLFPLFVLACSVITGVLYCLIIRAAKK